MDQQYPRHIRDGWQQQQQLQSMTSERADYTRTSAAIKSIASRQNSQPSERIVSAAEQLLMLASVQTSFPESNGFVDCRSNSRDSGLGKDSDSGSSSSSIQTACRPLNFVPGTQTPARHRQNIEGHQSPRHPCSQPLPQLPNQPVCTVMPMTNCDRNSSHVTARQCAAVYRHRNYQSAQHKAYQYLNRCEAFSGRSPQMAVQPRRQPEYSDFSCRDGKQYSGQRFPVPHNVVYYGNSVNQLHYSGPHPMPSVKQLSQCRGDVNGRRARYAAAAGMSSSSCGRVVDCVPVDGDVMETAFMSEHHPTGVCGSRESVFNDGTGRHARGHLVAAEQQDVAVLYSERCNVNVPYRSVVDLRVNVAPRCDAAQQRYRPYDISADVRHTTSVVPRCSSQSQFYQTSPRSVMQFRLNDELFYDSYTSGIH